MLSLTGGLNKLDSNEDIDIVFISEGRSAGLQTGRLFYPLNLVKALMRFKILSINERSGLLKLFAKLLFLDNKKLKDFTVNEWLKNENQHEHCVKTFWETLAVGMLNTRLDIASARVFTKVLKLVFLSGRKSASMIIPGERLSAIFSRPAEKYIQNNGGKIFRSSKVEGMKLNSNKVCKLIVNGNETDEFFAVISAVPLYALSRFYHCFETDKLTEVIKYSPIVCAHIWLNQNIFSQRYYAISGGLIQGIFNHGKYISIVISAADEILKMTNKEFMELAIEEIKKIFGEFENKFISHSLVIREKRATFVASENIFYNRPGNETQLKNFFICGDWTDTGLPGTIEGAVQSGKDAAKLVGLI
jgi:uncharacterized protein with NAD-binding domain and iron-sulfur cluster